MQTRAAVNCYNWGQGFRAEAFVRVARPQASEAMSSALVNQLTRTLGCPCPDDGWPVPDFRRIQVLLAQHITITRLYVAVAKIRRSPAESAVAARSLKTKPAFTLAPHRVAEAPPARLLHQNESELERDNCTFHSLNRKAKNSDSFPIDDDGWRSIV